MLLGSASLANPVIHTISAGDISAGHVNLTVTAGDLGTDGNKSISAHFTDAAGHSSTTAALVIDLDTTIAQPTVALAHDSGSSPSDKITNDDAALTVSMLDPDATRTFTVDGGTASASYPRRRWMAATRWW